VRWLFLLPGEKVRLRAVVKTSSFSILRNGINFCASGAEISTFPRGNPQYNDKRSHIMNKNINRRWKQINADKTQSNLRPSAFV
jgi:hypothetical protein